MQEIIDAYGSAFTGYIPLFLALIFVLWFLEKKLKPRAWKFTVGSVLMAAGIFFLINGLRQGRIVGVLTSVLLLIVGARSLAISARMTAQMKEDKRKMATEGSE